MMENYEEIGIEELVARIEQSIHATLDKGRPLSRNCRKMMESLDRRQAFVVYGDGSLWERINRIRQIKNQAEWTSIFSDFDSYYQWFEPVTITSLNQIQGGDKLGKGKHGHGGKSPMTLEAAARIQSHADKTGQNQDFKSRAQRAASKGKK